MNTAPTVLRRWRQWVASSSRHLPLESPAACMAGTVLFLAGAWFLLPRLEGCARQAPLVAEALAGWHYGWSCLRGLKWLLALAAHVGAWLFQARCLQLCYPEFYDPYLLEP
jgi:hypothetical protein